MILDKKNDLKNKGKSIKDNSDGYSQAKVHISLYTVPLLELIYCVSFLFLLIFLIFFSRTVFPVVFSVLPLEKII
jgi:hypothetical protein